MAKCLKCGAGNEWLQGKVPNELPEELEVNPECNCVDGDFLYCKHDMDTLKLQIDGLKKELEQERVQHAGCLTVAEGWGMERPPAKGDYGWSVAYQATFDLRRKMTDEKQRADVAERLVDGMKIINHDLADVLRALEWNGESFCPWCMGKRPNHDGVCKLQTMIAKGYIQSTADLKRKCDHPYGIAMSGPNRGKCVDCGEVRA